MITDSGLTNYCDDGNWIGGRCVVGTGNTAPSATDTALVNQVAETNTHISGSYQSGWNSTDDYVYASYGWSFPEGTFSGQNLAEIGFKTSSSDALDSRSQILDAVGSPTVYPVDSDEVLHTYYELRMYYPTTDISTSFTDVTTGITHSAVIRPSDVNAINLWRPGNSLNLASGQWCYTFDANSVLGNVDSQPTNPSGSFTQTSTLNTYTNGDLSRSRTYSFGLNLGNATGGIGAVKVALGSTYWQVSIDPPIAKSGSNKWDFGFEVSVSRAVIP